jgi:hypothetical protein
MNFILFLLIELSILYGYIVIRVIVPLRYGLAAKLRLVCVLIVFEPFHPYISDLHMHDNTWIYVSSGTGYWGPPLRLGVPSEITLFTLKCVPV